MVESYIAMGFGLSMIVYFFGQMLRCLIEVIETIIRR